MVVAAPVAPIDAADRLGANADEVIVVETPEVFFAIGQFYLDFAQTTDHEVIELLHQAREPDAKGVSS